MDVGRRFFHPMLLMSLTFQNYLELCRARLVGRVVSPTLRARSYPRDFFFSRSPARTRDNDEMSNSRDRARARGNEKKKKQIRVTTRHHSGDIPSRNIFETKRTRSDQTEESRSECQKESENEKDRQCSDARGNSASPELASPRKDGKNTRKK